MANADVTTVLIAVLGVAGTLSSPLLGQRTAARARQQESDLKRQELREEREYARQGQTLQELRSMYAALNTAARQYTQELRAYLRMIVAEGVTDGDGGRTDLAKARKKYRDLYSDAQMILPDKVLFAAALVNDGLGNAYGMVKRLEFGESRVGSVEDPGDTIESVQEYCSVALYNLIIDLRQLMREDLGVSDPEHGARSYDKLPVEHITTVMRSVQIEDHAT
jgi:type II secretory pathway pseudopilin PulG